MDCGAIKSGLESNTDLYYFGSEADLYYFGSEAESLYLIIFSVVSVPCGCTLTFMLRPLGAVA